VSNNKLQNTPQDRQRMRSILVPELSGVCDGIKRFLGQKRELLRILCAVAAAGVKWVFVGLT